MCGQKPYLSISDQFCILGQKTQSLGQDFVAARCLPVRDIKGTECKTVVAGCRSIDNAEFQPQLSRPPSPIQNSLREHQLAQPGYSALLRNALLWASTKHDPSCIILHVMRHSSAGSIRSQVWLAKRCWHRKTLREQASFCLAHIQAHGIAVYACHRNHQEWLQSKRTPWTYLLVPTKQELWGLTSL